VRMDRGRVRTDTMKFYFIYFNFLEFFWLVLEGLDFRIFFIVEWIFKSRLHYKKIFCKKLLPCFLGEQNGGRGSSVHADNG
jgi:hypothetical protein